MNDDTWSTSDIVENRNNWSLASDGELLKHLQQLSKKLVDKSQSTLNLLKSFEDEVNQTCTKVSNIDNRFKALSDTQFIESKVQDSPEIEINDDVRNIVATSTSIDEPSKNEDISLKLKEAVGNGIKVLDTHYDIINVTDSDSESEEPQEILLKARNPYMSRRLPYIIGSEEFTYYDHLGLVDTTSEEEEEDEESDEEILSSVVPQTVKSGITSHVAKTQIIRVSSSDSEDSEKSASRCDFTKPCNVDELGKSSTNIPQLEKSPQAQYSFADHLNATLQNYGTKTSNSDTSHVGNTSIFSPPPFPTKDAVDTSSDDEKSVSSDDMNFAKDNSKKITAVHPAHKPNTIYDNTGVDNCVQNSSNKTDSFLSESQTITGDKSPRLSSSPSSHESFSSQQPAQSVKSSVLTTHVGPPKQIINAISAELNAKLKNMPRSTSSSDDNESDLEPLPVKSQPTISSTDFVSNTGFDKLKITNDRAKEDKTTSIFASSPSKPKSNTDIFAESPSKAILEKPEPKKTFNLFDNDEDDDFDDLFESKKSSHENKRPSKTLFDTESKNLNLENKSGSLFGTSITSSNVSRKPALFDSDDSDSGDDIFAIINSQKLLNSKTIDEKSESNVIEVVKKTNKMSNDDNDRDENEINGLSSGDGGESRNTMTFDSQNVAAMRKQRSAGTIHDDVSECRADVHIFGEKQQSEETRSKNDDSSAKPVVERATFGVFEETNIITTKMSSKNDEDDYPPAANNVENETSIIADEKAPQSTRNINEKGICTDKLPDEGDGNLLGKNEDEKQPKDTIVPSQTKPGKLAVGRGLNININALLPGSRWSPKPKEDSNSTVADEKPIVKKDESKSTIDLKSEEVPKSLSKQPTLNISSVMKERAKISTKRRPPSRRARTSNISSQDPFSNDITNEDDEQKTNESKEDVTDNVTEIDKPSSVEYNQSVINREERPVKDVSSSEKKRTSIDFDELFQNDDETEKVSTRVTASEEFEKIEEPLAFSRTNSENIEPATTVVPSMTTNNVKKIEYKPPVKENSASVLTGFIKDRSQLSQKQPPSRKVDVAESNFEESVPSSMATNVNSTTVEPPTNTIDDIFSSNVVSLSPVSKKVDLKELFEDSDDEDDLFADVFSKSKSFEDDVQPKILRGADEKPKVTEEDSITETNFENSAALPSTSDDFTIESVPDSIEAAQVVPSESEELSRQSLFASLEANASSGSKAETVTTKRQSASYNLFADEDESDLFSQPSVKAESPSVVKPPTQNTDVEKIVKQKQTSSAKTDESKKKIDLFADGDDYDLFSSSKKKLSIKSAPKRVSLFGDDDDGDDLFGSKKTSAVNKSSGSSK